MARPRKDNSPEFLPVKLLKNYVPAGAFTIDGREPDEMERARMPAGSEIELPAEEARHLVFTLKIAERNDEF